MTGTGPTPSVETPDVAPPAGPAASSALVRSLLTRLGAAPEAVAFSLPDAFGGWFELTAGEFLRRARSLAAGLVATGLAPGDVLGVLSTGRAELALIDVAAAFARIAVLPLSPAATATDLLDTLETAGARAVVVETVRDFARFDEVHGDLPLVAEAWQIGLGDLDKLIELGADSVADDVDRMLAETDGGDVAALLDDGAGGFVRVTHDALMARIDALVSAVGGPERGEGSTRQDGTAPSDDADHTDDAAHTDAVDTLPSAPDHASARATPAPLGLPDSAVLQILPPTVPAARLTTLAALVTGARLGYLAEGADLISALRSFRPTLVVGRPDLFAEVERATLARAEQTSRGPALTQALEVAELHSAAVEAGPIGRGLRARFVLADALVLRGLRKAVGGNVHVVLSIADDEVLPTRLRRLMRALDIRPLEAVALARTAGLTTVERVDDPFDRPEGTAGAAVPGVELAVAPDGTVSVRDTVLPTTGAAEARGTDTGGSQPHDSESPWTVTAVSGELDGDRLRVIPATGETP